MTQIKRARDAKTPRLAYRSIILEQGMDICVAEKLVPSIPAHRRKTAVLKKFTIATEWSSDLPRGTLPLYPPQQTAYDKKQTATKRSIRYAPLYCSHPRYTSARLVRLNINREAGKVAPNPQPFPSAPRHDLAI